MEEKVIEIIAEELEKDPSDISLNSDIINDLGADSLDVVELMMALEDAFEVEVSDEKAQTLKTVKDVVTLLDTLQ